jgi:CheY-like chemotaxis protein
MERSPYLSYSHEQPQAVRVKGTAGDREKEIAHIRALTGATSVQWHVTWSLSGALAGVMFAVGFRVMNPLASVGEVILLGLMPMLVAGILINRHLRLESQQREALIQEQITFVESRHEELRDAYLAQELTRVELRRKVVQLTAIQRAGLLFSSTLDREALMQKVLEALTSDLQYDRAMISFFDPVRQVVMDTRVLGVSPEIQAFVRAREIPVTDPMSPEGIVLLQVELQGGTITARSEPGQGAELSFTIPLLPTIVVPLGSAEVDAPRILVVEDDPEIRQLLQDRLRAMGYRVQLALGGVQAVEVMRGERFQGMILDIDIPSLDGVDVLRHIRTWDQQVPIVMVAASDSKESAVRAIGMGAQAYMLKPFDVDELQRVADYWFRPFERPSSESEGESSMPGLMK